MVGSPDSDPPVLSPTAEDPTGEEASEFEASVSEPSGSLSGVILALLYGRAIETIEKEGEALMGP